ncbi:MAG: TonB-dependent receptor [Colwellia sp.]|nr:TonB-dependent receptor [Colwellia sp.]
MYNNSKVAKSIRLALMIGAASTAAISTSAFSADEVEEVERIEVTGSRIKRTDLESASPITVFTSEDLASTGAVTLEEFIQNIPAITGAAEGSSTNNGSRGYATASLRGLGAGRTLVLINGRRFASGDLNSIPVAYIERVEVLRDGASTSYGSDAIAGVINFITKKDFEGIEIVAQYDETSEGDGETAHFSITTGASSDKGNIVFSLGYTKRNKIMQGARSFSDCPIRENDDGKFCGGSGTIPYGQFFNDNYDGHVVDPTSGVVRPFEAEKDAFNFSTTSYLVTPQEVFTINAAAIYEISDEITLFTEGGFTNRKSDQQMAPEGTFWAPAVPAANPYNPVGEEVFVVRRLRETAGRAFAQDFSDYRMVFGLEGMVFDEYSWDMSYNYSRYVDTRLDTGRVNPKRIETLLDPALCDADGGCPEVWDVFHAGTLSQEMIDYAFVNNSPVLNGTTKQFMANISGDIMELPAGAAMFAFGIEKRWEEYNKTPDGAAALGQIYSVAGDPTSGAYNLEEAYIEVSVPVLADLPMVESLNFSAAARYSDFSNSSKSATNTKFGIEWTPVDGLLIRATQAQGFRAPSIKELFEPQQETNLAYNEPCIDWGNSTNANVRANCAADGLPEDFNLSSDQSTSITGGNPDLSPEESDSFTAGFVYTHDSGFTASVDYFDIEITNGVGTAGTNNVITTCYESANFSDPLCEFLKGAAITEDTPHSTAANRSVLGSISGVLLTNANLGQFNTSGVDFDMAQSFEVTGGTLRLSVNGTYLNEYSYTPLPGSDKVSLAGKFAEDQWETNLATYSRIRANMTVGYSADDWSVNWVSHYQSATDDLAGKVGDGNLDNVADSVWYHDIQGSYFLDNYTFTLGARNVTDIDAPYTTNNQDANTIPASYDTAGRYMYAKVAVKF